MCREFSMEELMEATNNFNSSAFMGEGSNGKVSLKNSNMLGKISAQVLFIYYYFLKLVVNSLLLRLLL